MILHIKYPREVIAMLDFNYAVSTKIFFGRNKIENLNKEIEKYGDRILFIYGQESIKTSGLYDIVRSLLEKADIEYVELGGVQPNPRIESVRQGIQLCTTHDCEFILAVGGGSVIDCAKTIAAGIYHDGDPWDFFVLGDSIIYDALPIGTVLTFAGTGSEMNGNAVISNPETEEKLAIHHDLLRPRFSILDPSYTFTVPPYQTAAGVADIFSHVLEQYFSPTTEAFLQDRLSEAILKTCLQYGPIAVADPQNYEARAQIMWASSLALNGLLGYGRLTDWATHAIEHALSALYDVTHGVGLAILTPAWMRYVLNDETMKKFVEYAANVWGISGDDEGTVAQQGIIKTQDFFSRLGLPKTLNEVAVTQNSLDEMAKKTTSYGTVGRLKKLGEQDVRAILQNAY